MDELVQTLEEQKDVFSSLEEDHQLSLENVSLLEARVSQRDAEVTKLTLDTGKLERENEELRGAIGRLEKERGREVDERSREFSELVTREAESRRYLEDLVSEKAGTDILVTTLQNRVVSLDEEVSKLRRQVHELQQESATKEVTLTQLNKWREQDKEDIKGLNIALDSKQQELELVRPFSLTDGIAQLLTLVLVETQDGGPRHCWEHTSSRLPQTRILHLQHTHSNPSTLCLI